MVRTMRKSPRRSAKSSSNTAALLLTGRRDHVANGGGVYALSRATAACIRHQISTWRDIDGLTAAEGVKGAIVACVVVFIGR